MTIRKIILCALAVVTVFAACKKTYKLLDENSQIPYVDSTNNGYLKIVHAYASLTPGVGINTGPKVMVVLDGKIILRDSMAYNATFPNASGAYAVIPNGSHNLLFVLSRAGTPPPTASAGDTVFKATINISAGKHYTSFLVDSSQSPGVLTVQDNYTVPVQTQYQVRFANLIPNPIDRYDVYADSIQTMVATNIGYRELSNFITVPIARTTENFSVRKTGTTTVVYTLTGFTPTPQRVYTLYARGRNGSTGRTPGLTYYTNR